MAKSLGGFDTTSMNKTGDQPLQESNILKRVIILIAFFGLLFRAATVVGGTGNSIVRRAGCLVGKATTLMALFGLLVGANRGFGGETSLVEYQVKAAFLINFPKYVDWPAETFAETNSPIVIAVLGETKVAEEIQKVIAGRSVNGREIVLKRLASGEEPGVCHILFISAAQQEHSADLLAKLKNTSVLTIGESNDFLERGGIINLVRKDQNIGLEVNLAAAGKARIKVSSNLLSVATIVKGKSK
jgi:hypothetical protein